MKYILFLVVLALAFWYWRSQVRGGVDEGALPVVGDLAPAFDLQDT